MRRLSRRHLRFAPVAGDFIRLVIVSTYSYFYVSLDLIFIVLT
ncbi:Uncharacterized protein ChrSV_4804 [Chromobacterium vaccinii]|nr:Uncharacterized protein ChrSW_4804 [Chromobacterium vaccinii]QND92259.1 Uncharacterized protein ChrSV_4804 [Chromobacterium vaccinii]